MPCAGDGRFAVQRREPRDERNPHERGPRIFNAGAQRAHPGGYNHAACANGESGHRWTVDQPLAPGEIPRRADEYVANPLRRRSPAGTVRLKTGGGHGGHNGVRDIVKALGSSDFHRLRIGIGRPTGKGIDYVLGEPSKKDAEAMQDNINEAIRLMPMLVAGNIQDAMKELHTEPEKDVGRKSPKGDVRQADDNPEEGKH